MDINDWWHVVTNGKEFVGKRLEGKAFEGAPEGRQLVDVQECVTQTGIVSDERNLPRPRSVVMTFPSRVKKLQIPTGALWVPISAYKDKGLWEKIIVSTEQLILEQRAQESGLHLARQ